MLETPATWIAGEDASSPNLAALVQEIVNLPGWQSGDPLALLIEDQGSSGSRRITSVEASGKLAASLEIRYAP